MVRTDDRTRGRARTRLAALIAAALLPLPAGAGEIPLPTAEILKTQREEYEAVRRKTILELQQFRATQKVETPDGATFTLTSLQPAMNAWFLLEVKLPNVRNPSFYHIENSNPEVWTLALEENAAPVLLLTAKGGEVFRCEFGGTAAPALEAARKTELPFAPICADRLFLRNRVTGTRTSRERTAEFLRDNVWFGESIVGIVKDTFYQDAYLESGVTLAGATPGEVARSLGAADLRDYPVISHQIGFRLDGTPRGGMAMGEWYAVEDAPGIFASVVQPGRINPAILARKNETHALDAVESRADVYLVAFDLALFDVGYEAGTDHPALNWSPRPSGSGRNNALPGPDGIASSTPVVTSGMISPALTTRVAATFTGGYKREHGAFRMGDYAFTNYGHHYGFVSQGVVLSKLQPNLATVYVLDDGTIGMKTWTVEDAAMLPRIRFARQNGVPLLNPDPVTGEGVPGALVRNWGPGNWSGSADAQLRTLRGGACMKTVEGRQFLIYAYFSTGTPSSMARTFQAYGCSYAMLLDMNSVEHTYMALYTPKVDGPGIDVQHLVKSMAAVDGRERNGAPIPRFVSFADNRDFFYLLRKEPVQ